MAEQNPLVSIIVITYNSSKYVLETLESAKAQTYQNIELIVSDDCSSDNTVDLCKCWIEANKARFVRTELITSDSNTGIPANCNRGLYAAKGKWIKSIAGDDILLKDCVENFIKFVINNSEAQAILSYVIRFTIKNNKYNFINILPVGFPIIFDEKLSSYEQYKILLKGDNISFTPSFFVKRKALIEVGLFDERFRFIEDYPMWLKLTSNNIKLYFMDKITVYQRLHDNNVHSGANRGLINITYIRNEALRKIYVYPFINTYDKILYKFDFYAFLILKFLFNDNLNIVSKIFRFILFKIMKFPFIILSKI